MGEFQDRVAMVVGATGALGVVVARRLATAGAALVLPVRNPDKLAMASPDLAGHERALVVAADPADETKMSAAVAAAIARFGRIDVLVNAAGAYRGGDVATTSPQVWQELWEANLLSTLIPIRAALPAMLARKSGAIVNVGSKAALAGGAGAAAYSVTKTAVLRLTESLAAEVRRQGVRVNCVLPGTIDTGANRAAMPDADRSGWVAPTSVAEAILFLASDAARDVHGAALRVFGLGG